ncbi:hypothetical protein GCM10027074_29170 [Streptomyces deserti]
MSGGTRDTTARLRPHELALLRGGPRAAVTVAVAALYLRGAVEAGRPGTIRVAQAAPGGDPAPGTTPAGRSLPPLPPLTDAVLASLQEPAGIRELVKRPDVRVAVAETRVGLAEAGLLRFPLLGPTRAARRLVRALRERHPPPTSRRGLTEHDKLLAVALHGEAALKVVVPRFALRAGLTARVEVADKGLLRHSPRAGMGGGGSPSTAHFCGSGGGGGGGAD